LTWLSFCEPTLDKGIPIVIHDKIEQALNKQIRHEISAAYSYLAMAAYFDQQNLAGFAHWMQHQRQEELEHAMRLFQYVIDRGGKVELETIEKPQSTFNSIKAVFEKSLDLEKINTQAIDELYSLAVDLKDYATQSRLQWFLDEQVEEEKTMSEILSLLEIAGDNKSALLALNNQLGQRASAS